jgi:hypothetical protein
MSDELTLQRRQLVFQRMIFILISTIISFASSFSLANHLFDLWHHSLLIQIGIVGIMLALFGTATYYLISKIIFPRLTLYSRSELVIWVVFCVFISTALVGGVHIITPDFISQPDHSLQITASGNSVLDSQNGYLQLLEIKSGDEIIALSEFRWETGWEIEDNYLTFRGVEPAAVSYIFPEGSHQELNILYVIDSDTSSVEIVLDGNPQEVDLVDNEEPMGDSLLTIPVTSRIGWVLFLLGVDIIFFSAALFIIELWSGLARLFFLRFDNISIINVLNGLVLLSFIGLYIYNVSTHFWVLPESGADPVPYLMAPVWKNTYPHWYYFDRLTLGIGLGTFSLIIPKAVWLAGVVYIGFVNVSILILSMWWAYRVSGFIGSLMAGIFINVSYFMLGYSTYIYSDQNLALYSLITAVFFVLFIEKGKTKYIFWAGFFTAFTCLSKMPGAVTLVIIGGYLIFQHKWGSLKPYILGGIVGSAAVLGVFTLLYGYQSTAFTFTRFISAWTSNPELYDQFINHSYASYLDYVLLSTKFFPFIGLFIFSGAYKDKSSRYFLYMAWGSIAVIYYFTTFSIWDQAHPHYIYTGYVFTIVALSIYIGKIFNNGAENTKSYFSQVFNALFGILILLLIIVGIKTGMDYAPVQAFSYSYNYYTPLDVYNIYYYAHEYVQSFPKVLKQIYVLGPLLAVGLLSVIEITKRRASIYAFAIVFTIWSSISNGGLAYKKVATSDQPRAEFFFVAAETIREYSDHTITTYFDGATRANGVANIYEMFVADKYPRNTDFYSRQDYLLELKDDVYWLYEETQLDQIQGDVLITDNLELILENRTDYALVETIPTAFGVDIFVLQAIP